MTKARAGLRVPRRQSACPTKAVVALAAACLIGLFSTEIADTDFWWHLKTGQYIVEHRLLPVPDPFAYTTALHPPGAVARFNLTHEWLSQVLLYLVYAAGGFPAVVLVRAALLAAVCGLAGLLSARLFSRNSRTTDSRAAAKSVEFPFRSMPRRAACALLRNSRTTDSRPAAKSAEFPFRSMPRRAACALLRNLRAIDSPPAAKSAELLIRCEPRSAACALSGSLWAGIEAAFATASVAVEFTADRPAVVTFLGVAVFITLLELRRCLWALPPLALIWANCHSGFFLGWVVLLAYCIETVPLRSNRTPIGDRMRLWLAAACAIVISGLNPNGFGVLSTLLQYRRSELTANLIEWHPPLLWGPPYGFDVLLYAAALVLILSWRRVRSAHWALFAAFAAASLIAFRNIMLVAFLAPVLIAAYLPFRIRLPLGVAWAAALLIGGGLVAGCVQGAFFQLRIATWTTPAGAAGWLLANHITGRMFNTYEQGGYLIWRLWPQERVFIDGRALSESLNRDYRQILFNRGSYADQVAGPRAELMERYGIQVVVMNALDYVSGALYPLALALGNPAGSEWQLVYEDSQDVVFMRQPPPGIPVLANKFGRVLRHLDAECEAYIESSPDTPLCARTMGDYWLRNGVRDRGRRMLELYLRHARKPDPEVEERLRRLDGARSSELRVRETVDLGKRWSTV